MIGLREVLATFETGRAHSIQQLSDELGTDAGVLESMLEFWVRKGRLRHAGYSNCAECGVGHACAMRTVQPRRYELATGTSAGPTCSSFRRD